VGSPIFIYKETDEKQRQGVSLDTGTDVSTGFGGLALSSNELLHHPDAVLQIMRLLTYK
jgi:hypothetical protein